MKAQRLLWWCLLTCPALVLGVEPEAAGEPAVELSSGAPEAVYLIPVKGMIEPALVYVVRRGLMEARREGAAAVLFVMDTPGGTLDAAGKLTTLIQNAGLPTYTFVDKRALSAGAIIALSTGRIYMAPGSVIGDAMPILMSPLGGVQDLSEPVQEKMVSGVAAMIRAAAEQGGHDPKLAEAMVRRELEYKLGDEIISPEGQLLTLTNEEALRLRPDGAPLLSAGTVAGVEELLAELGLAGAEVRRLEVTVAERMARFIAGLAPLFLLAGLLGLYIEFRTPGIGLPGMLGALSLAVFFWGHHIAGLAGMEDMVLFAFGVALLIVEVFLLPGFGVVGALGLVLMAWALMSSMADLLPDIPWYLQWTPLRIPFLKLTFTMTAAALLAALLGRFLPNTPGLRRLVLSGSTSRADGFSAARETRPGESLVGRGGRAVSSLRPAGVALIGEERVDVVTQGEFLEAGTALRVVETSGNRVVVEPAGLGKEERSS